MTDNIHLADRIDHARRLADDNNIAAAKRALRSVLDAQPDHYEAHYLLAVCAYRAGEAAEAETAFRGLIAAKPTDHRALHGLGLALEGANRLPEALDAFRGAARLAPEFEPARRKLTQHDRSAPPAAASPPPTSAAPATTAHRRLRNMQSLGARCVHVFSYVVALPLAVVFALWASWGFIAAAFSDGGGEAVFFGGLFAAVAVALLAFSRLLRRVGRIKVDGVVSALEYRQENGGGRNRAAKQIVRFRLVPAMTIRGDFPFIPVEMTGRSLRGTLRDGDEVVVCGMPTRLNYVKAAWVRMLANGERIYMKG